MAERQRSGTTLFVVTIVIAIVALLAYGFALLMRTEYQAVHLRGDQMKAQMLTRSGAAYVHAFLHKSRSERESIFHSESENDYFRDVIVDRSDPIRFGRFSVVAPKLETSDESHFRFGIENESSKLPLHILLDWDEQVPGSARHALLQLPGMNESIADSILDWMDADDTRREFGAESEYYQSLHPSRLPSNRVPNVLEELLRVKGVRPELLFGHDQNRNYLDDRIEFDTAPQGKQPTVEEHADEPVLREVRDVNSFREDPSLLPHEAGTPWIRRLTLWSAERNVDYFGQPRINLNDNNLASLRRLLEERFDSDVANFIVALRKFGPYQGNAQASESPVPTTLTTVAPAAFRFDRVSVAYDARVAIGSVSDGNPDVYFSPWTRARSRAGNRFSSFLDAVTVSPDERIVGRINISSAPLEVIRAIPGITLEIADKVYAAKTGLAESRTVQSPFFLVEESILRIDEFRLIEPYVSTGGDVCRTQVVGLFDSNSPWHRVEMIVDGTDSDPDRIYSSDLTTLGRGFSYFELAIPDRHANDSFGSTIPPFTANDSRL